MVRFTEKRTPSTRRLRALWLGLLLSCSGIAVFAQSDVAERYDQNGALLQSYTSLLDALYDASAGETVKLLSDLDISSENSGEAYCAEIITSITLDGQGHRLTVNRFGLSVAPLSNNFANARGASAASPSTYDFDVTIKNITIANTATQVRGRGGRCVVTGGKLGSLTLEDVTLTTDGSPYTQGTLMPLVIGGTQTTAATINVTNSTIATDASGAKGYAITTYNPVNLNISGSTLTALRDINFAEADGSAGSNGSTIAISDASTLTTGNAGSMLYFNDSNIETTITGSSINAGTVAHFGSTTGNVVTLSGTDNTATFTTLTDDANGTMFEVEGGTFNHVVPNAYLAEEYDMTINLEGESGLVELAEALNLTSGSTITFRNGSIKGEVIANGGSLIFDASCGTNDITVTGDEPLNLTTGKFAQNIAEQYLAEHYATNLISGAYVVKPTVQIAIVNDLLALAALVNTPNGAATKGNTYELTADIDLSGVEWTPIGNVSAYPGRSFQGTFDGKGHTISNLKCVDNTANYACAALFGSASAATIKNLTLANVDIQSKHWAAGILAYQGDNTTVSIENCHIVGGSIISTPELIGGEYDNGDKVGAIVGYATNANIVNCSVEDATLQAYRDLGGLAGYISGGEVSGNTVKDVTLTQSNENAYKLNSDGSAKDMSETVGYVVGGRSNSTVIAQATDTEQNTTDNVVIADPVVVAKIGTASYPSFSAAVAAAGEGDVVEICQAGTYYLWNVNLSTKNITIKGAVDNVVFDCTYSCYNGQPVTSDTGSAVYIAVVDNGVNFENVTLNLGNVTYRGFDHQGFVTMKDCTLNGKIFTNNDMEFINCTFNAPGTEESGISGKDYSMWTYAGDVTFTDCTFNSAGKVINVYNDGGNHTSMNNGEPWKIIATNCTFNSTYLNKAAFNVKATSGTNALAYEVIIDNCVAEGNNWPAASESTSLVVLNSLVQVDDIKASVPSVTDVVQVTTDPATGEKTEEVLYTTRVAEYNGIRYDTFQEAIDAAEAADDKNIVINLLNDATLDIAAWSGTNNAHSIGTANTETITINGNGNKLTFMTTNTDWNNVATMNDAQTKLILNDMTIDQGGVNTKTTWNSYDIVFHCAVELNNVSSNRPIAVENSATVENLTINADTSVDAYAIWISPRAENQTIAINGLDLTGKRGIKIDDQYVTQYVDVVKPVELNITNATFTTEKKSAILVKSAADVEIEASNLDIASVAADSENAVWVDEDRANQYGEVTIISSDNSVKMIPEGGVEAYNIVRHTGETVNGYYKDNLQAAIDDAEDNQTITLKEDLTLTTVTTTPNNKYNVNISKSVTIDGDNHTITSSTGKRAMALTGEGNNITLKNMSVVNGGGTAGNDWTVGIVNALTANLENVTIDGTNAYGYNQPLTIGGIDEEGRVTLNVKNSTIMTNEEGSAHYAIIAWHPADITVENSTLKGWANVYLKPAAEGSVVNISNSQMISKGASGGESNDFALISMECGNNQITLDGNTAAISTPAEDTYNTLFNFSQYWAEQYGTTCNNNVVKLLGSTTFNGGDTKYGGFIKDTKWEEMLGAGTNNAIYFDETAKGNFEHFFTLESAGRTISADPIVLDDETLYTLDFQAVAKLYSSDLSQSKYFTSLKGALEDDLFEAYSQIDLLADVTVDEDITVNLDGEVFEEFAINCGDYTLKAGAGHILLPTNVTGSTSKATDVFAQVEGRDDVVANGTSVFSNNYPYNYLAEHHEIAYVSPGETDNYYYYFEEVFEVDEDNDEYSLPEEGATITLQKDITLVQDVNTTHSFTLNFNSHNMNRGGYTMTLGSGVTVTTDRQVEDFESFFLAANATDMVIEDNEGSNYTYTVVSKESEGIYELADGNNCPYALESNVADVKVSYTRTFSDTQKGKYQSWYVPFDYTITGDEDGTFYKIDFIASTNTQGGEVEDPDAIYMWIQKMSANEVVKGNRPYLFKPNSAKTYTFEEESTMLYAKNNGSRLNLSKQTATFDFYGTYATIGASEPNEMLYMYGGQICPNSIASDDVLGPYRWYIKVTGNAIKEGYSQIRIRFIENDEDDAPTDIADIQENSTEIEGYYSLDGKKMERPAKGVNIVRYTNGTTRKLYIK